MKTITEKTQNNAFFRQLLFLAVLITIGVIIFKQLSFFFGSFLGAITLYVVLRSPLFRLTEKRGWRPWTASLLLVLLTLIFLLGLGFLAIELIYKEIPEFDTSHIFSEVNTFLKNISNEIGFKLIPENIISSMKGILTKLAGSVFNTTYSFAANVFMMMVILYFMLANGRKLENTAVKYMPFEGDNLNLIKSEIKNMIYSNSIGIPLIMFAQAIISCLFYWAIGIKGVFFWGFLTAVCGLLPVVGTAIIYVPLAIYMILTGNIWSGIFLVLYGLLVISNTDNLVRILLMKKMSNTHPLIVIFGVILGLPLFGFWGIIFGPLMISGFLLLLKIYYREYKLVRD